MKCMNVHVNILLSSKFISSVGSSTWVYWVRLGSPKDALEFFMHSIVVEQSHLVLVASPFHCCTRQLKEG